MFTFLCVSHMLMNDVEKCDDLYILSYFCSCMYLLVDPKSPTSPWLSALFFFFFLVLGYLGIMFNHLFINIYTYKYLLINDL
jgi:hypothetical protein